MKFEIDKVYKTVEGKPIRILWIYSRNAEHKERGTLVALHEPYTRFENIIHHDADGRFSDTLPQFNLTNEEYKG